MKPERLNALTDGVIAIVITIMVLELHVPEGEGFEAIRPALPLLGAYGLSFVNIGILWTNHHYMTLYSLGVVAAILSPWLSVALYIAVSSMWLIPDRRFEKAA